MHGKKNREVAAGFSQFVLRECWWEKRTDDGGGGGVLMSARNKRVRIHTVSGSAKPVIIPHL